MTWLRAGVGGMSLALGRSTSNGIAGRDDGG